MLLAMLNANSVTQCASMFTGADSPLLPNEEGLLTADADLLQAMITAAVQGASRPIQYGPYTLVDNHALLQAFQSIPTDIAGPLQSFSGRPDTEVCRLAVHHYEARLLLPDDGTFQRTAIWSMMPARNSTKG